MEGAASMKVWFVGRVYRMRRISSIHLVDYRDLINLMDHPSNMKIGL